MYTWEECAGNQSNKIVTSRILRDYTRSPLKIFKGEDIVRGGRKLP